MPIYEFYCSKCNTVFNFFSKTVNSGKHPACPLCRKRKMEKLVSSFAMTGKSSESDGESALPIDERRMEKAISALASEAGNINENDPRQAAKLMRKFTDMTGVELGSGMKAAMDRLEAGEDPAKIESEMGSLIESEEQAFLLPDTKTGRRREKKKLPPRRDSTLYEM